MTRMPEIVPVSDLRQGAASLLKRIRESRDPVVVTQRGRAAAVLLDDRQQDLAVHAIEARLVDLEPIQRISGELARDLAIAVDLGEVSNAA